jgi:site-specific DNA recombinase
MTTGVYLRISEDRLGLELGIDRQREDTLGLSTARGCSEPLEFVDNDISATSGKRRPGYEALMDAVDAGEISRVIVWHTSRIWRNRAERADGIERLRAARASLLAVRGPELDMTTAAGRGLAGLLGEFDTMESEIKAERSQREVIQRAEQGRHHGGPRAYGYTADGMSLVEEEAANLARWYGELLAGRSISTIAREAGKHHSSMLCIFKNCRNAGLRVLHGVEYPGAWPAIVPADVWRAAVALLADKSRRTNGNQTARRWLLSGLAGCQRCGGKLVAVTYNGGGGGRLWPIYICHPRRDGCSRSWAAARLDEWITKLVTRRFGREDVGDLLPKNRPDIEAARLEAQGIRDRLKRLASDWMVLGLDDAQVQEANTSGRARLAELEAVIGDARRHGPLAPILAADDPVAAWKAIPVEQVDRRQAVVRSLMAITLGAPPRGRGFDPEKFVFVDWIQP